MIYSGCKSGRYVIWIVTVTGYQMHLSMIDSRCKWNDEDRRQTIGKRENFPKHHVTLFNIEMEVIKKVIFWLLHIHQNIFLTNIHPN